MEHRATPETVEAIRLHGIATRFAIRRVEAARGHRLGDVLAVKKRDRPAGNPVAAFAIRVGATMLRARGFVVGLAGDLYALDPVVERDGDDLTPELAGNGGWWTIHPDPRADLDWSADFEPDELAFA